MPYLVASLEANFQSSCTYSKFQPVEIVNTPPLGNYMSSLEICIYSKHLNDKFEPDQVTAESSIEKSE